MSTRARLAAALLAVLLVVPVVGWGDTVTVSATVSSGSRTLNIKSLAGAALSSVALGAGGSRGFMVSVDDVRYSRAGYQVTASMSDLYAVSGGVFDCTKKIAASNLSLAFLTSPTSLTGVGALAQPVWDLTGSLTGVLAATLGIASGTPISVGNLDGTIAEHTLSGVFAGTEGTLPIGVSSGTTGAFTAPSSHSSCDPTPSGSPTSRLVMSGGQQNQASLFTWVQNAYKSAADTNANGTITGTELLGSGSVGSPELAEATRTALGTAGVNLNLLDTLVNAGTVSMASIYALLTATLDPLSALTGQSGTYVSLPKLSATIPSGTATGDYSGTMIVTLTDV